MLQWRNMWTFISTIARAGSAGCLAVAWPLVSAAQSTPPRSCGSCDIRWEVLLTFQADWRDGSLSELPLAVSRFARDEWIVTDSRMRTALRFDAEGKYIARLAREGRGPNESLTPTFAFAGLADSTIVLDEGKAELVVYDPIGRRVRSTRWLGTAPSQVLLHADGHFVVPDRYATRSSFGLPLHEFAPSGSLIRSFGAPSDARIIRLEDVPLLRVPTRASE